jgi:thiamine kinase-like enzyme
LLPLIKTLGEIEVPEPGPFKLAEDRWKTYVDDWDTLKFFSGTTLQHTDWLPHNVLIAADRPYLIDWAWPTLGAAWMDPAYFLIRLVASGHSVQDAERYAARVPAYAEADPEHLDLFAAVNVRMWDEITQQAAGRISSWMHGVVAAAHTWAAYRQVRL